MHSGRWADVDRAPLWTPAFVRLGLLELLHCLAAGVLFYGLPLYAYGPVGADGSGAERIVGAFAMTALLRPAAGRLLDRVGPRPLLIAGGLGAVAATLGRLAADTVTTSVGVRRAGVLPGDRRADRRACRVERARQRLDALRGEVK